MDCPGEETAKMCHCPYCDADMDKEVAFCVSCKTVIIECGRCGKPVREGVETCPHCGGPPG